MGTEAQRLLEILEKEAQRPKKRVLRNQSQTLQADSSIRGMQQTGQLVGALCLRRGPCICHRPLPAHLSCFCSSPTSSLKPPFLGGENYSLLFTPSATEDFSHSVYCLAFCQTLSSCRVETDCLSPRAPVPGISPSTAPAWSTSRCPLCGTTGRDRLDSKWLVL